MADLPFDQLHAIRTSPAYVALKKRRRKREAEKAAAAKRRAEGGSGGEEDEGEEDDDGKGMARRGHRARVKAAASASTGERQRQNKNQPAVQSSKRPVSRFQQVVEIPKSKARDPRFESLTGKFDERVFDKQYAFVFDLRKQEIEEMRKQLRKEKDQTVAEELKRKIARGTQELKMREKKERRSKLEQDWKRKERDAVKQGKKPFFLKQGDKKLLEHLDRFENLKKNDSSGLKKMIAKKRKHNAAKEHRFIPRQRVGEAE